MSGINQTDNLSPALRVAMENTEVMEWIERNAWHMPVTRLCNITGHSPRMMRAILEKLNLRACQVGEVGLPPYVDEMLPNGLGDDIKTTQRNGSVVFTIPSDKPGYGPITVRAATEMCQMLPPQDAKRERARERKKSHLASAV